MDSIFERDDSPPSYLAFYEGEGEEEEEEELELFPAPVSGFGESDAQSSEEFNEELNEEVGDSRIDDVHIEKTSIKAYQSTHPNKDMKAIGAREIGEHEAIWTVSSFRPNWGPEKLRDNNALTYWQSDCPNPRKNHTIDLNFNRATFITQVSIFVDYFQDESYTPKTIAIRGGTTFRDLYQIMTVECEPEFVGWINADITLNNDGDPFRVFRLQVAILNTHLNGRDTHIRQLKVYATLPAYSTQVEMDENTGKNTVRKSFKSNVLR